MKKFDLVKLIKTNKEFLQQGLSIGLYGIVLKASSNFSEVLFFNDKNEGDYATALTNNAFLEVQKEHLPNELKIEFEAFLQSKHLKRTFNKCPFKDCDPVVLIVEKEKYAKQGVHKGDTGVITLDKCVKNEMLVDFTWVDEEGECHGEIISVDINDLELVK